MDFLTVGAPHAQLSFDQVTQLIDELLHQLQRRFRLKRILLVPPDKTRAESLGSELATLIFHKLMPGVSVDILPALGTHHMMSDDEIETMYPGVPRHHILEHRWQTDIQSLGVIEPAEVRRLSEGQLNYAITVGVNRLLALGGYDVILSIGQVVPHEVAGIANQSKNIYIGVGGPDLLHKSHYLGAVYGMERIMGRTENPVRALFDRAADMGRHLPIVYLLTVRSHDENGSVVTRGLFAGDDRRSYEQASALCEKVNIIRLERRPKKVVVRVSDKYSSTWLANKAIYRTRMAIADGGELLVLATNVKEFAEHPPLNDLVAHYGYRGTPASMAAVTDDPRMQQRLSVPAHLIHGSTEGRFAVTYAPGKLTKEKIESVGYQYADFTEMDRRIPRSLKTGWHVIGGEEIYYIADPGMSLWMT